MGWHHSICRISLPDVQLLDLALDQNNHFNGWSYHSHEEKHWPIEPSVVWLQGGGMNFQQISKSLKTFIVLKLNLKYIFLNNIINVNFNLSVPMYIVKHFRNSGN